MQVLKATPTQAKELNGFYENKSELLFVLDGNNNLVCSQNILSNNDFIEIRPTLLTLPLVEYKPIETNEK